MLAFSFSPTTTTMLGRIFFMYKNDEGLTTTKNFPRTISLLVVRRRTPLMIASQVKTILLAQHNNKTFLRLFSFTNRCSKRDNQKHMRITWQVKPLRFGASHLFSRKASIIRTSPQHSYRAAFWKNNNNISRNSALCVAKDPPAAVMGHTVEIILFL